MRSARILRVFAVTGATGALMALVFALAAQGAQRAARAVPPPPPPLHITLPTTPASYIGVYRPGVLDSDAAVTEFTAKTGIKPRIASYYSGWYEPFQTGFAASAAKNNAVPLIQIDPNNVSLDAIARGKYDTYLTTYADAVLVFRHPVILSFGHEMNGSWFSWSNRHTSPAAFRAAWRHIVTLFRAAGALNVTWLWTVNIIDKRRDRIPSPAPWWPGRRYVTWVGIDGYYYKPSWQFAPLFGPTIKAVRALTHDRILIAETGAAPAAGKPAKIIDLFAGIRAYGLLGFVWFDAQGLRDWSINTPAAAAAFRQGARTYAKHAS